MKKTVYQHVVPQTWLKRFTYNKNKTSVYAYSKTKNIALDSKNISNIAGFEFFYDFHEDVFRELLQDGIFSSFEDKQYVEKKFLSYNIENKLGLLLKEVIESIDKEKNKKNILSDSQKVSLSIQIGIQFFRTNVIRAILIRLISAVNSYSIAHKKANLEIDHEIYKEFFHFLIMKGSRPLENFIGDINNKKWVIYKTTDENPFVISDNPVVFQKIEARSPNICIPLSKNYLLVLYHKSFNYQFDNVLVDLSQHNLLYSVSDYNNLQFHQCENEIYSPINDFSWIDLKSTSGTGINQLFNIPAKKIEDFIETIIKSYNKKE